MRNRFGWVALGTLVVTVAVIWFAVFAEYRKGMLTIHFFDVGQGDAALIEAPNGNQILIDGGPDKTLLSELGKAIPFYDRSIDLLVVSNPDKDHMAGFVDVMRSYRVSFVLEPGTEPDTAVYREFVKEVEKEKAEKILARRGIKVWLDKKRGVFLEILFPDRDVSKLTTNDGSIVTKLVYGETEVLFPGDAPEKIESYVAELDRQKLESDVLKVGHHGSKTSTSAVLLGFTKPKLAIISAGRENRYGHPHQEVIDRLRQFEVKTLGTYEEGTITLESDGLTIQKIK